MGPALPPAFLKAPLAHRGYHDKAQGIIENSPSALKRAIAAGYGIELDVQLTRDGAAVMFHDATLDRVADGSGPVRALSAAELAKVSLTRSGDTIPTLSEVLDLVDGRVPLLIELKDQSGGNGAAEPFLERAVAETVKGYSGPVALMSFNPFMVGALAELAPDVARGITTCAYDPAEWTKIPEPARSELRDIRHFDQVGASFISHDQADLTSPRVAELKANGVPILCWTVKSAEVEARARLVADNITFEGYAAEIPE